MNGHAQLAHLHTTTAGHGSGRVGGAGVAASICSGAGEDAARRGGSSGDAGVGSCRGGCGGGSSIFGGGGGESIVGG
eukprot:760757-Prymnesium_polylepis.1